MRTHPGITRRTTLRTAAAALLAAGGAALAGCANQGATAGNSASSASGPIPIPQSGVTRLTFQAPPGPPWNKTTIGLTQQFVDDNFNANPKYKGIWATVSPAGWGSGAGQITADIAGSGYTDVWAMCCNDIPALEGSGFVQPLDALLRRDNISVNHWSQGHILANTYAGQLYGLPSYDGTLAVIYRQDLLDDLGLPYPDPDWDYRAAADLWAKCVGKTKTGAKRAGVSLYWDSPYEMIDWWLRGWGGREMDSGQTQATMSSPEGAACLGYAADLFASGAAIHRGDAGLLASEKAIFLQRHAGAIEAATTLGTKYKWNILPNPVWPKGRTTFVTIDCYMLNKASKDVNAAWELLKWLALGTQQGDGSFDHAWAKFQIQICVITPALVDLWDYWMTTATAVAPPLQGKDLHWYYDAAKQGYAYPTIFFKHQPNQAAGMVDTWTGQILSGKLSPELGLRQMQDQINALQAAGAAEQAGTAAAATKFPTDGPAMAAVPPGI